jgi:hypothetical protein
VDVKKKKKMGNSFKILPNVSPNKTGDSDPWDSPDPASGARQRFPSNSIAIWRLSNHLSTHCDIPVSAFYSICLTSSLEVFGKAAPISTIRSAVCCFL